jgi:hypothetical protein
MPVIKLVLSKKERKYIDKKVAKEGNMYNLNNNSSNNAIVPTRMR